MDAGPVRTGALDVAAAVDSLLAKTPAYARGTANLLLSHALDTAAVGSLMWDRFLAPATRRALDEVAGGRAAGGACCSGCAASTTSARRPRLPGEVAGADRGGQPGRTPMASGAARRFDWHHTRAGAHRLRVMLADAGWPKEQIAWVWPLVAGHHGHFPWSARCARSTPGPSWRAARAGRRSRARSCGGSTRRWGSARTRTSSPPGFPRAPCNSTWPDWW
ncbi:HD domain-containing protein [Streptomyces sp. M19]